MSFNDYLTNVFIPAQNWAETDEGKKRLAQTNITEEHIDDILCAIYGIYVNFVLVYVGESVKPYKRGIVHLYNMNFFTSEWGMTDKEFDSARIEWKIIESEIHDDKARKVKELHYIHTLKPILQCPDGCNDHCINLKARRDMMKSCFAEKVINETANII